MFTTLNLSLMNQLPQESGPLAEVSGDGAPVFDGTTFAASLSVSFDDLAATGNPLPLAGIELPVNVPPTTDPVEVPEGELPLLPIDEITDDLRSSAVAWPPGLEPPVQTEKNPEAEPLVVNADIDDVRPATESRAPILPTEVTREAGIVRDTAIARTMAGGDVMPRGLLQSGPTEASVVASSIAEVELAADPADGEAVEFLHTQELRGERPIPDSALTRTPVVSQDAFLSRAFDSNPQGQPSTVIADSAAISSATTAANSIQRAAPNTNTAALPTIATPVADPGWSDSVADRVLLMANNRLGNAEIRLTPAELGPVRVQVSIEDGAANVAFQATQAATREALEQSLPRLRELLSDSGLSLDQASVSDQGVRDGGREAADEGQTVGDRSVDSESEPDSVTEAPTRTSTVSNGLVDTFV